MKFSAAESKFIIYLNKLLTRWLTKLHLIRIKKNKKWKSTSELSNYSVIKYIRKLAVRQNSAKEALHKIKRADETVKINIRKVIKAIRE